MTYFNHLDAYAERVALIDEAGRRWTYADFLAQADQLAVKVGRRCLVFIICANQMEPVAAYVGFLRAGIVPVLLSRTLDPDLLQSLMESYHPAFVFFLEGGLGGQYKDGEIFRLGDYVLAATGLEQDYGLAEDLALLLTTSGSTGSPKLVRQSYRNIQSNTDSIIEYLGIRAEDRAISTLPLYYTYGLSILNTHLAAEASLVLTESSVVDRKFWRLVAEEQVSTFGGVPYIYQVLKKLRFGNMNLPSLRYLTQAGGRLEPDLLLEFCEICRQKDIRFIVMYGQTEATARMSWLPWEHAVAKSASIGFAIPGGKFWLADEEMKPIEKPGEAGELVYDGPNVTLGYAENRHDLAKADERGGRLFTGDMAKFDAEGFFYVTGRKKRFLKIFGSRVNLDEIESLLNRQGYGCACGGVDDRLKVYLENEADRQPTADFLESRLALNRAGFEIVVIDAIPRNESGKVLYAALP